MRFAWVDPEAALACSIAVALPALIVLLVLLVRLYLTFGCETTLEKSPSLRKVLEVVAIGATTETTTGADGGDWLLSASCRFADTTEVDIGEDSSSDDASRRVTVRTAERVEMPVVMEIDDDAREAFFSLERNARET